ncbi:MAG TPA: LacI family DNA-binding transcriptional regulator [Lachnospiraceae bacterium]|nr:LacI family DNA-binding transcriptional regulator [Lachnospiraceae bacterium]
MNISEIAKMAGVSRAAVSRYLNNGYISDEKKEKIRTVIDKTGYKPSVQAQALRSKKTRMVGVVLPRINSDSISSIVAGIVTVLNENGYQMILATTENNPAREIDYIRVLSRTHVDGIIFIATVFTKEHRKLLNSMSLPLVIVGQRLPGFSCIFNDDFNAGFTIASEIIKTGRKKISYIGVMKADVAVGLERCRGYEEAMKCARLEVTHEMTETADFSIEAGYEAAVRLLKAYPDAEAIICATDSIAVGVLSYLKEKGIPVPEKIALAGFGDNRISRVTSPPITTVHFSYRESGSEAARKILQMIQSGDTASVEMKLGFSFEKRESI